MKIGDIVWVEHPTDCYVQVKLSSLEPLQVESNDSTQTVDKVYMSNPSHQIATDDLTQLTHLNEPNVLQTLFNRYQMRQLYTDCGIALIALNPYAKVDSLYSKEIMDMYRGRRRGELEPHLFSIAESAFNGLNYKSQSIIVSGESGSGKTSSSKYIIEYLNSKSSLINAINPVLESFGNAKTTRNDNSSRFGKYLLLGYDEKKELSGIQIKTYLLEKSRVFKQGVNELNYHVFYIVTKDSNEDYKYLNKSDRDYSKDYNELIEAMKQFDITVESVFKLVECVLLLGNINTKNLSDSSELVSVCQVLGIDKEEFIKLLTTKELKMKEVIVKELTEQETITIINSLSKHVYSLLFDWLVERINEKLVCNYEKYIGILDIYGFEYFDSNSLEQLLINYANEKLQQQFNQQVFEIEQKEYKVEALDWRLIEFDSNEKVIQLVEDKLGLFGLLDEECRLKNGSESSLLLKYNSIQNDKCVKSKFNDNKFTVKHFAANVTYSIDSFLEKNRDSLPTDILVNCNNSILSIQNKNAHSGTVVNSFKHSLGQLMNAIYSTQAHYIRCIKPNTQKKAFFFHHLYALNQLKACGILATIKMSSLGYPSRLLHRDFIQRFAVLCKHSNAIHDILALVNADMYQKGKTKVFLRSGVLAMLENKREMLILNSAVCIDGFIKGDLCALSSRRIRYNVLSEGGWLGDWRLLYDLSRNARNRAIRIVVDRRQQAKAVLIQNVVRGYLVRKHKEARIRNIIMIQCLWRRRTAKRELRALRLEAKSVENIKQTSYRLESKLVGLSIQLKDFEKQRDDCNNVIEGFKAKELAWNRERTELMAQVTELKSKIQSSLDASVEKDAKIRNLENELEELRRTASQALSPSRSNSRRVSPIIIEKEKPTIVTASHSSPRERMPLSAGHKRLSFDEAMRRMSLSYPPPAMSPSDSILSGQSEESIAKRDILAKPELRVELVTNLVIRLEIPKFEEIKGPHNILFPAHIVTMCITDMLQYDLFEEAHSLFTALIKAIQEKPHDNTTTLFWVANLTQLICLTGAWTPLRTRRSSCSRILFQMSSAFNDSLDALFSTWISTNKASLSKLASSAILDMQQIPGFKEESSFISRLLPSNSNALADMLAQLTAIANVMDAFCFHKSNQMAVFSCLFSRISSTAFNEVLLRKKFGSWKRGVQIQYNVQTINEWCETHGLPNYLERIAHVSKLYQLPKSGSNDIQTIVDVCFMLNASQIQKLLVHYVFSDFEERLSMDVLHQCLQRFVAEGEGIMTAEEHYAWEVRMWECKGEWEQVKDWGNVELIQFGSTRV